MRTMLVAALLGGILAAAPASQTTSDSRASETMSRAFVAGGAIRMDLSAGEYRITGTPDSAIKMTWSVRDARALRDVSNRIDTSGRNAEITTHGPREDNGNYHFEVRIEVPTRSDLHIRLTAGELEIDGIAGNKDVGLHAGEMTIAVGRREDYRRVQASVWAGEVQASPFGKNTGGLFRSVDWEGRGAYVLDAHVKAGEIRLR